MSDLTPAKVRDVTAAMLSNPSCRATYHREQGGRILILAVGEFESRTFHIEGTQKPGRIVMPGGRA